MATELKTSYGLHASLSAPAVIVIGSGLLGGLITLAVVWLGVIFNRGNGGGIISGWNALGFIMAWPTVLLYRAFGHVFLLSTSEQSTDLSISSLCVLTVVNSLLAATLAGLIWMVKKICTQTKC